MSTKCSGCDSTIFTIQYMECAKLNCKKTFDLNCLAITTDVFETFTQGYKDEWICPECTCLQPKGDNSDTPIRSVGINKTFTPSTFVTTQRGSRRPTQPILRGDSECEVLAAIRDFRSEITSRFEEQAQQFQQFWNVLSNTRNELADAQEKIRILENKVNTLESLEVKVQELTTHNHVLSEQLQSHIQSVKPTACTYSYSDAARATNAQPTALNTSEADINKCGATKRVETSSPPPPLAKLARVSGNGLSGNSNNNKKKLETKKVLMSPNEKAQHWICRLCSGKNIFIYGVCCRLQRKNKYRHTL